MDRSGKEVLYDYENKINMAVFPGLQVDEHDLYLIVYVFMSIFISLFSNLSFSPHVPIGNSYTQTQGISVKSKPAKNLQNLAHTFNLFSERGPQY